jgi:hypothetical protein
LTPDPTKAAELGRFIESVDRFISSFKQACDAFKEFHDRRNGPVPAAPLPGGMGLSPRPSFSITAFATRPPRITV